MSRRAKGPASIFTRGLVLVSRTIGTAAVFALGFAAIEYAFVLADLRQLGYGLGDGRSPSFEFVRALLETPLIAAWLAGYGAAALGRSRSIWAVAGAVRSRFGSVMALAAAAGVFGGLALLADEALTGATAGVSAINDNPLGLGAYVIAHLLVRFGCDYLFAMLVNLALLSVLFEGATPLVAARAALRACFVPSFAFGLYALVFASRVVAGYTGESASEAIAHASMWVVMPVAIAPSIVAQTIDCAWTAAFWSRHTNRDGPVSAPVAVIGGASG